MDQRIAADETTIQQVIQKAKEKIATFQQLENPNTEEKQTLLYVLTPIINFLEGVNQLDARNEIAKFSRELYHTIDFGFHVNETVYFKWKGKKTVAVIKEHTGGNQFLIKKETGGEEIVPGTLLEKYDEKQ